MSDEINTRLREKTMQIAALNQRLEVLQAQLSGSVRRATQLSQRVEELEAQLREREEEILRLKDELKRSQNAMRAMGAAMRESQQGGVTAEAAVPVAREDSKQLREQLDLANAKLRLLEGNLSRLSAAAMAVILGTEGAVDVLKSVLAEAGDSKHRVLVHVMRHHKMKLDDLAALLVSDKSAVRETVERLVAEGELEMAPGDVVQLAKKYREAQVPTERWQAASPEEIFDDLEKIVSRTDDSESVARALETAVDLLEQKMARGGALIFQMRRTASSWKSSPGSTEDLRYKIKEWKSRAAALQ